MKKLETVQTINISPLAGVIELSCLLNEGVPDKEWTWLTFFTDGSQKTEIQTWDNEDFILETMEKLLNKEYTQELLSVIEIGGFKKKDIRKQMLSIYYEAKKLNIF
jgi:hypothetical protein